MSRPAPRRDPCARPSPRARPLLAALPLLAGLAALQPGCGGEELTAVSAEIRVTATHVDTDGALLLDFGPVPVLNQRTLELLVDNLGQAELVVDRLELQTEAGIFASVGEGEGVRIPSGGTAKLPIGFRPEAEAPYEGTLTLVHDDVEQPPVVVKLRGVGSTIGRLQVDPPSLDFGRVGEQQQVLRGVTLRSVGTAPLIIESIELTEDTAPEFSFAGSARTPATLPAPEGGQPGGEVSVPIRCAPTGATTGSELTGTLRIRSTDPEQREVLVPLTAAVNRAPIAAIAPLPAGVLSPGDTLALDGTPSSDPDGDVPLTYAWRVFRRPFGSSAELDDPASPTPSLRLDAPGEYELGLDVADAQGLACLHPQADPRLPCTRVTVLAKPADDLYFELVWDHPQTDLDLHVRETGTDLYSSRDCYWGNVAPDLGTFGSLEDDPRLLRDDLNGYGPETIVFSKPAAGSYDVSVIYYSDHGASTADGPAVSRATLRVFLYGVLAAEISRDLTWDAANPRPLLWDVLRIGWPEATLTTVDTLGEVPSP